MSDPIEVNRTQWAERLRVHLRSEFYDVAGFKAGRSSLRSIELHEVGDVAGRDLLHLQCHFGLDSMSWARLGARVTGVDFSSPAIEAARMLARELGLDTSFVFSTVDDLPAVLDDQFDIVFSSYGVLPWLPNLGRWAEVVAHFLRPGGTFYIVEFHPVVGALAERARPELQRHYFTGPGPIRWEGGTEGDYADPGHVLENPQYEWIHTLGDAVTAIVGAGLVLEFLHEHPVMPEPMRPFMVRDDDGWWRIPDDPLPLTYSIRASKPR